MNRFKITTIVGARPQFVKAAAMSRAFAADARFDERLIHTGQHFDYAMSERFFRDLGLPDPAINLGIANLPHGAMTGRMIEGIETDLIANRPDAILVYGDTNSTLAGALAAVKQHVPVIHAEAGMRSGRMDVPEEVNRVLTDRVSALLLCASRAAMAHLEAEGLAGRAVHVGDLMYDIALLTRARIEAGQLKASGHLPEKFSLLTIHRAENTERPERLAAVIGYARQAAQGEAIVFPVHPRTEAALKAAGLDLSGIILTGPLGYHDFHAALARSVQVLTDSGGVQKEAYFHRVPCITLRDETEWTETIAAGWNRLWTDRDYKFPRQDIADYGDGNAAARSIAEICKLPRR